MEYIILTDSRSDALAGDVTWHLSQGWELVGGVSLSVAPGGWTSYAQAMKKDSK
jgi:hypothetical protein